MRGSDLRHQRHRADAGHPGTGAADAAGLSHRQHLLGRGGLGHAAAAYTASKWALRGLTRSAVARARHPRHPRERRHARAGRHPAHGVGLARVLRAALAEIPLGRVGTPADIAPTIVFLVSDDSAYYTGAELVIDGGLTAHVSHKRIADATRS